MEPKKVIDYKLKKKIFIKGKIKLLTGLHIGGTDSGMEIGGIDSGIVRNPIDNLPYIPGSSLKGKMRALIDLKEGKIMYKKMGAVEYVSDDNPQRIASILFGTTNKEKQRPARLIVRDAYLEVNEKNKEIFENLALPYAEAKTEVVIDRITSKATPRTLERVPAGAYFNFEFVLNIIEGKEITVDKDNKIVNTKILDEDKEKELLSTLIEAMELLEDDYLGGSGSRGYGQIKFIVEEVKVNREIDNNLKEKYFKNFLKDA